MPVGDGTPLGELNRKRAYPKSLSRRAKIIGAMLAKDSKLQSNSPALWTYLGLSELGGAKT